MLTIASHKFTGFPFMAAQAAGGRLNEPTAIVLHDTAQLKKGGAVAWFTNPNCNVSAHLVVERDGSATQLVGFNTVAFHAGKSSWNGRQNCNVFTIGIEIVNPGYMQKRGQEAQLIYTSKDAKTGKTVERIVERFPLSEVQQITTKEHGAGCWLPYTDAQVKAVTEICQSLVRAYPSITEIVTHWLISPKRKVDTNPTFPLEQVRQAVFGMAAVAAMPSVEPEVVTTPGVVKATYESKSVWALLMGVGSWIAAQFEKAVNECLDWVMWMIGVLPNVVSEVKTTLTNGELMAGWLKVSWPKIAFYVTVGCIAIAVVRHVQDKRKLAAAAQAKPQ
jgi:N-acetyl-anhydromuramyl-L-alanine amidase AmpD